MGCVFSRFWCFWLRGHKFVRSWLWWIGGRSCLKRLRDWCYLEDNFVYGLGGMVSLAAYI